MKNSGEKKEKLSDNELVSLIQQGDAAAFATLSDRYMPALQSRASRYANIIGMDMEDFLQDGMLALFRAAKGYRPDRQAQFGTYAMTCINNSLSDSIKAFMKNARQNSHLRIDDLDEGKLPAQGGANSVEERFLDMEATALQAQKIENLLSGFEQQVLKLYLTGHTYQQISEILGAANKAVDNALQRVRRKLRPEF